VKPTESNYKSYSDPEGVEQLFILYNKIRLCL